MNTITFFIRPSTIFEMLENISKSEGLNITFVIDPKYAKKLKLVSARNNNLLEQYEENKGVEVLITKSVSYDESMTIQEFYKQATFELACITGCKEINGIPVISNMRIFHSDPAYRKAFNALLKNIKAVSANKILGKNPKVYVQGEFKQSDFSNPELWKQ